MPFVPRKRVVRELERYEKERPSFTKRELKRVTKPLTGEFRQRAVGKTVSRKEFREAVRHAVSEQKIRQTDAPRLFTRWRKWFRAESTPPHPTEESKGRVRELREEKEAGYGVPTAEPFRTHVTGAEDQQFATGGTPAGGVPPELRHVPEREGMTEGIAAHRLAQEEAALQETSVSQGGDSAGQVPMSSTGGIRASGSHPSVRKDLRGTGNGVTQEPRPLETSAPGVLSREPVSNPVPQVRESVSGREEEQSGQGARAPMMQEVPGRKEIEVAGGMEREHNFLQKLREQREAGAVPSGGLYERKRELSEMIASGETVSPQREARSRRIAAGVQFQARIEGQTFWRRAAWWGFLATGALLWLRELVLFSSWWGIAGTFVAAVLGPILIPFFPILEWLQRGRFPWLDFILLGATAFLLWYGRWESKRFLRNIFGRKSLSEHSTAPTPSDSMDVGRR